MADITYTPTHIGKLIGTPTEAMSRLAVLLGDDGPYKDHEMSRRHAALRKFGDMITQTAMGFTHEDRDLTLFEIEVLGKIFVLEQVVAHVPRPKPRDATKSALQAFLKLFEEGERKGSLFLSAEYLKRLTARTKRALKHYHPASPPGWARRGYQGAQR